MITQHLAVPVCAEVDKIIPPAGCVCRLLVRRRTVKHSNVERGKDYAVKRVGVG